MKGINALTRDDDDNVGQRIPAWLASPFILPKEQRKPLPWGLERFLHRFIAYLATTLGVQDLNDANSWWRSLFILPPVRPQDAGWHAASRKTANQLLQRLLGYSRSRADAFDNAAREGLLDKLAGDVPALGKASRALILVTIVLIALGFATTPLSWTQQLWLASLIFLLSLFSRQFTGRVPVIILISFSTLMTLRYLWWRATSSLDMETPLETTFALILFAAELYAVVILFLGFAQNIWPLRRKPCAMPTDVEQWPAVDVFIPTYDEPLEVVKPTVYSALAMDWPEDRLNVYLLDDGKRDNFKEFAATAGVHYIRRPDNAHAKAGNLNYALQQTQGEFVAMFDCDHIPVRSFLQTNMGWMLRDPHCALVQTPHHFFSPDPMERNLGTFHRVPNEGALFYGLIQDGNDLWNATFFCGSCAILRRAPLEEIGGIAVETVTEDSHTALKLHRLGYNSIYCGVPQAAGLATESLASHISQRIRWARGMSQIFNIDNPYTGPGLRWLQRICYSSSMLHFLHGIPRIIFLCAPLLYLIFGLHIFGAGAIMIAAFVLPHLVQSSMANAQMHSKFRHSFWGQVYESTLAWYIALPTTLALFNARTGKFNVTAKGGLVDRQYFDWKVSEPFVVFILISLLGVVFAGVRLFWWNSHELGTVLLNLAWTLYNLILLGAAAGVAEEQRQVRRAHRVAVSLPAVLYLPDGRVLATQTLDFSLGGLRLNAPGVNKLDRDTLVHVGLHRGLQEHCFAARVVAHPDSSETVSLRFEELDIEQEKMFLQCTFGRADLWAVGEPQPMPDKAISSFAEILAFGIKGYRRVWWYLVRALSMRLHTARTAPDPHLETSRTQ